MIVDDFEGKLGNWEFRDFYVANKIGGLPSALSIGNLKEFFVFFVFKPCFA